MDIRVSKMFIELAFWAVICDSIIIFTLTVFSIYNYAGAENTFFLSFLPLIDCILLWVLAVFIKRKSIIASIILVSYQFLFHVISIGQSNDYTQILWFVFFVLGLLGALRYKKIMTESENR